MTQDKDLLLKYLCMAFPYMVIVQYKGHNTIIKNKILTGSDLDCNIEYYKPYLRSMSSMTEEERKEYKVLTDCSDYPYFNTSYNVIEWLLKNHFDFMGLIPKGLAIEINNKNNPY